MHLEGSDGEAHSEQVAAIANLMREKLQITNRNLSTIIMFLRERF